MEYLLKGIMIGLMFGMPLGAVGAMSIQRTIRYGSMAGFISGMASSFADVLYACVGAFGLHMISDFLFAYQLPINLMGALLLMIIAIRMMIKKEVEPSIVESDRKGYLNMFLSSFAIAITNPAAILSFLFAFSVFDIQGSLGLVKGIQLVFGVLIGTLCWWLLLVSVVNLLKKNLTLKWMERMNVVFGLILMIIGSCIWIKTL